jgi:hypothetical protein
MLVLDKDPLADNFVLSERSGKLFIPVCALAEVLSLAVSCREKRAFGFINEESRPFVIDLEEGYVVSARNVYQIDKSAFLQNGDIFVEASQLSKWLPIDFTFQRNTSSLQIHAREALPIQGFKERQKRKRPPPPPIPKQLDDFSTARSVASIPTIDLASQVQLSGEENATVQGNTLNSLDLSGDLLYMSAEAHLSAQNNVLKRLDASLYRRTDAAFYVGPIPLTQVLVGSSQVPYIDGIGASSKPMYGALLSNRAIYGSAKFLTHDVNGSLPQGWDAELFHNGQPIAYQPPTSDNMYHFQNLQVYYGINNYKVILHGPLGERRESEETFIRDSITPKGELLYTLSTVFETGVTQNEPTSSGTPNRETDMTFTSDFGITKALTGAVSAVRHTDLYGIERDYGLLGLRTAVRNTLVSMDFIEEYFPAHGETGGLVTIKSSSRDLLGLSLEATQRIFWNYDSPQYPRTVDPLVSQTTLRNNSTLAAYGVRVPLSVQLQIDSYKSGDVDEISAWRFSGGWNGWNGAVELDASNIRKALHVGTVLQISTKLSGISIRGQGGFSFAPTWSASTINLNADTDLGGGFLLNSGISHDPTSGNSELKLGLSKRYGLIGYSFSATGSTNGAFSLTAGLRTSIGADTANHQAIVSADPLSPNGMIAVSAAVAEPGNPVAKPLAGVGFLVNGSRAYLVPGSKGWPVIVALQPDLPVDVTVDMTTVEDPFMVPVEEGCHIVPRAGVVSSCKFTMTTGGEIDGMVFVRLGQTGEVPLKDVRVDLLGEGVNGGKLQASTRSQESGYYLFKTVKPGNYRIVVPGPELARLKAAAVAPIAVTMPVGGDMVSGNDLILAPAAAEKKEASAPR